nr:unnamed protein product [Callosobruchus chinensis]
MAGNGSFTIKGPRGHYCLGI